MRSRPPGGTSARTASQTVPETKSSDASHPLGLRTQTLAVLSVFLTPDHQSKVIASHIGLSATFANPVTRCSHAGRFE